MKQVLRSICVLIFALNATYTQAQPLPCPPINTTYSTATGDTTICDGQCAPIHMTGATSLKSTNVYTVTPTTYTPFSYTTGTTVINNQDDVYSGVIQLPFPFCYFGNKYTSCVIGANGQISFNIANANGACPYNVQTIGPAPAVSAAMTNCIMGAFYDLDPSVPGGSIKWNVYGTAPCRTFVVSWWNVPYFDGALYCAGITGTQQIVLYESTYAIDIFIESKPICAQWINGLAVEGIEDATSTIAYTVPGRNATQWTPAAGGDGYRFTPDGTPSWTFTAFNNNNVAVSTQTLSGDTVTASLMVCPVVNTTYTIKAVANTNCDSLVLWDTVNVDIGVGPPISGFTSTDPTGCGYTDGTITLTGATPNDSFIVTYTLDNVPQPPVTVVASANGTITITGISQGTVDNIFVSTMVGCVSGPFGPLVFVDPVHNVDSLSFLEPATCGTSTGAIFIYGVKPNATFTFNYLLNNVPQTPITGISNANGVLTINQLGAGSYDFVVIYNACPSDTLHVILNDPQFLSSFDYTIRLGCNGDSVIFQNESGNGTNYLWDFGDNTNSTDINPVHVYTTQGVYTVVLHTFNGTCEKTTTHEITLVHPVISSFTAIRDSICEHQTVQFDGSSSTNAYQYVWDFGDGKVDSTNKVRVSHTYDAPGTYAAALTVIDFVPCPNTSVHPILVAPFRIEALHPDTSVCIYAPMQIENTLNVPDFVSRPLQFAWTPASFLDDTTVQQPNFYAADTHYHTYVVTMTSAAPFNCITTDTVRIFAQPHVNLLNVTTEQTIMYGQSVHLNADGAYYFTWVPALYLDNANIKDPVSMPAEPITYTLYAMNQYGGCRDTAYVKINLIMDEEFVPTAFTPNGDGKNDIFRVTNLRSDQKLLEFRVFDRWGQKMFETADVTKGWDGNFKGQAMDSGVFQYLIRFSLPDGTQRVHKGDVTLIR